VILNDVLLAGSVASINGFIINDDNIRLPKNLTFTETINIQLLYKKVDFDLSRLEKEMELQEIDILRLEKDINFLPEETDQRQECDYRLNSLKNAVAALKSIERIERQSTSGAHSLETNDLFKEANRALANCLYTPFTQMLKNRLANVEDQVLSKGNNNLENTLSLLDRIRIARTVIELDEVLLELLPDDYMNLSQGGRLQIAEMMLKEQTSYTVVQDVLDAFRRINLEFQKRIKLVNEARTKEELILALNRFDSLILSKYSFADQHVIANIILEEYAGKILSVADILDAIKDFNSKNEKNNDVDAPLLISIETIKDLEGKITIK